MLCVDFDERNLVVGLSMAVTGVTMTVASLVRGDEKVLIDAVSGEEDGGSSQTGEKSLEAVPSREGPCESPGLTVQLVSTANRTCC